MRWMVFCVLSVILMSIAACNNNDPIAFTDSTAPDKDTAPQFPDDGQSLPDQDDPEVVEQEGAPDADADSAIGGNCKTDTECAPNICVKAKCSTGCTSDADCANYPNTTCNTKLGRCLNTLASSGACNETNCPSGCCYAEKGFLGLKCASTAALNTCGICAQGEVYLESKQCVPAACKVGDTKCQAYNSYSSRSECFECMGEKNYLCAEDTTGCTGGSALMTVNVMECVPAGESCSSNDLCCSGMPCIKGYCY
ncbi:MAG TPA: hypothetical protein PLV42_06370 [bacterium]|nr:hypothetical protein [bacterium]